MKNISLEKSVRLVLKIGSSLLIKNNKFNKDWLETLIEDLIFFRKKKIEIIVVASGSVSLGKNYLNVNASNQRLVDSNYIIYAGRISKEKGLAELVDAYKKSDLNGITLKIYGEGPLNLNYFVNEGDKKIEIFDVVSNDEIKKIISNSLAVITTTKLY